MTQAALPFEPELLSDCAKLAAHFRCLPERPIWNVELAQVCGGIASGWRTRVSELRRPPWNMVIENIPGQHGRRKTSAYIYHPNGGLQHGHAPADTIQP